MKQDDNAKWKPRKLCLLCSYSQSDKHVSRRAASAINNDRRCWSRKYRRWFGRTASPASKAFSESRLRRPRHLMYLVLPTAEKLMSKNRGVRWTIAIASCHCSSIAGSRVTQAASPHTHLAVPTSSDVRQVSCIFGYLHICIFSFKQETL